ncbi:MAG: hypothetical protein ACRCV0_00540 [Brevinema sp.]
MIRYLLIFFTLSTCHTLPENFNQKLIGTWINRETILTPSGQQNIQRTATFNPNTEYILETIHPINGTSTVQYKYETGTINSFPAYILYDNTGTTVGFPEYFSFKDNDSILITSTNSSMILRKIWVKK